MIRLWSDEARDEGGTARGGAPAIALEGIAQRLGGRWALRGVSLRVQPGEVVAVVGHNGSGKTTLLRVVATLLRPTRGRGQVDGHDLRDKPDGVRAAIGMLAHASGVYDDLTAAENLAFALRMLGRPAERATILEALATVGLEREAGVRVRAFSSGMQRRVALARVMLQAPRVLLLDEPYNSFDDAGVALVDDLLLRTRAGGGAALVVAHDLKRGGMAFDRVVTLREGAIVDGPGVRDVAPPDTTPTMNAPVLLGGGRITRSRGWERRP